MIGKVESYEGVMLVEGSVGVKVLVDVLVVVDAEDDGEGITGGVDADVCVVVGFDGIIVGGVSTNDFLFGRLLWETYDSQYSLLIIL
ncbi:MAG: hypothetical protein KKC68_00970 [Candidatus Thermoplasmatota archaeon]|nr:hypothetical protein [Candidatus Thermoplasmatota archaeon]MBU1940322.1 hypothetical protein [Candidatus Thermoplasmatota archaeon]